MIECWAVLFQHIDPGEHFASDFFDQFAKPRSNRFGITVFKELNRPLSHTGRLLDDIKFDNKINPWGARIFLGIAEGCGTRCRLLALVSGAGGVGVGFASMPLDGNVMVFTLVAWLLTSVLSGMLPALATRKVNLRLSMAARAVAGASSVRMRQTLIAGEVALTVLLLAALGLVVRTLVYLQTLPPGFNPNGLVVARASLDDVHFRDPVAFRNLLDQNTAPAPPGSRRKQPGAFPSGE